MALTLAQSKTAVLTLLNDDGTKFDDTLLTRLFTDVVREVSIASPNIVVETSAVTTTVDDRTLTVSVISSLLDDAKSIFKAEYKVGEYPREYRGVTYIDDATIELDIDSAPDATGNAVSLWCEKLHTLSTSSTLSEKEEAVVLKGVMARAMMWYGHNQRGMSERDLNQYMARAREAMSEYITERNALPKKHTDQLYPRG